MTSCDSSDPLWTEQECVLLFEGLFEIGKETSKRVGYIDKEICEGG